MHLPRYLGLQHDASRTLADSFRRVGDGHAAEPDVNVLCHLLAGMSDRHVERLGPLIGRYGELQDPEPERLRAQGLAETRSGPVGLLRDLQDLHTLAGFVDMTWTVLGQAAQGLRDRELLGTVTACQKDTSRQMLWLTTHIKQAAPQALIAAGAAGASTG
ncbi:hypothetical protein [Streptomyces litchfieldiae]|uniref:Uncharacterized protein n=1 Tax=Streptomyces litchfieldiae TaxID=3075543 RepID=A0ABU2MPN8_9ACTN|nr:hypothetical protein [Streptomyces sp. DSM 44938]MDT0343580.1 hypothetical protein [Streptomyces sp. DSM 44938]